MVYAPRMKRLGCVVALVIAAGCSKDKGGDSASTAGHELMAKMITDDLPKIRAALTSEDPSSATLDCAQVENLGDARKAGKNLEGLAEYEKLCTLDLPLAVLTKELARIEAARAAKPDEKVLSECYNAKYTTALEQLAQYKHEDTAKGFVARFATACPDAK